MIDVELMHEIYVKEINLRIKALLEKNLKYQQTHVDLKKLITEFAVPLEKYLKLSTKRIFEATSTTFLKSIKFPMYPVYEDGKEINFKAIKLYIEKYIWCNTIIVSNENKIKQYEEEAIDILLYKKIILDFNNKVIDKIIEENYQFSIVPSFGKIGVIRNYNERKRVNWGASNKNKAEILARGGIPYVKADAEKIKNYQGEKWLEYHPPLDFFLHWHTKWLQKELNPFLRDYTYKPARGTTSIVTKLQIVKQDRERAKSLYTTTLNK